MNAMIVFGFDCVKKITQLNLETIIARMSVIVYVDDILFGEDDAMCKNFAKEIWKGFEMSMIGEFSFFLGLQIAQTNDGIFISQDKYIKEVLKKFGMEDCKSVITPMEIGCHLRKEGDSPQANETQSIYVWRPTIYFYIYA